MPPLCTVTLTRNLVRSVRQGHPWLYRDAVTAPADLADGAGVVVRSRDGRRLAVGFWDTTSAIAARLLTTGPSGDLATWVDARLASILSGRLAGLDLGRTNAFRWVHGEADGLPGIHVDVYDGVITFRFDGAGARAFYVDLPGRLQRALLVAGRPFVGAMDRETRVVTGQIPTSLQIIENGHAFAVDLQKGQKGGLFLDQRENRAAVAGRAAGKSVLNLFGYTGAFSVYAAAAGASRTDTVDLARPAIEAARENFRLNHLPVTEDRAGFHAIDAFVFLEQARAAGRIWDIVISDPPSFAPRKSAVAAAEQAYRRLHRMAAAVTAPGGLLCAASCSSHFPRDAFVASIEDGLRAANRPGHIEEIRSAGFDHPTLPTFPEGDYLKFAFVRV